MLHRQGRNSRITHCRSIVLVVVKVVLGISLLILLLLVAHVRVLLRLMVGGGVLTGLTLDIKTHV